MGRDAQFEAILKTHGAMLRRVALTYEADPERRRELLQEIVLAVWRALPRYKGEAPLRAFIVRVAHNRAITHVAREAAEPRRQPLDEAAVCSHPNPYEQLEARDQKTRLAIAVRALPQSLRLPAQLTLEGFTPVEIADILGLGANTVSIRLTRARAALRLSLNSEPVDDHTK